MSIDFEEKLQLALKILFLKEWENLSDEQFIMLGYDPCRFSYYGAPSEYEIKKECTEILSDAIIMGIEKS